MAKSFCPATSWVAKSITAAQDKRLLGFISLTSDGLLDYFYVHPQAQRKGVASALFNCLEGKNGLTSLHNHVSHTAFPFFKAKGFQYRAQQTVIIRGETIDNHLMTKAL
jgi:putative acetyltransferase